MTMSLIGENMENSKLSILGAGFACLDIIRLLLPGADLRDNDSLAVYCLWIHIRDNNRLTTV